MDTLASQAGGRSAYQAITLVDLLFALVLLAVIGCGIQVLVT
jgi:hypothetical protein